MSNVVEQVKDALVTQISAVLPTLSELDFIVDPSKQSQNSRKVINRYGVWPGAMLNTEDFTQYYVVDHDFRIQLLREYINRDGSDANQREVGYALYDDLSTIKKAIHKKRADCPALILDVGFSDASEIQFIEESDVALLEAIFVVKYFEATT